MTSAEKVLFAKVPWVKHEGEPIYSCEIHPDGKRFVTAGGDNKIKIWSFPALLASTKDSNYSGPTLLALIESHQLPVNVCRWSPNGRYLATGSDDRSVFVFELSSQHSLQTYGSDEKQHEQWKVCAQFLGHTADVLDISWSPSSDRLVSASVDNDLIVWNLLTKSQEAKLSGHLSLVRGVSWDPIGRYIASQSEDKQLRIWRTTDWQIESVIDKPFEKTKISTLLFQRISWSPDGGNIACCCGNSNSAILLQRSDWERKGEMVGHSMSVSVARFNGRVFRKEGKEVLMCAVGSKDGGVTVWTTANMRPVIVVRRLFEQPILDAGWSPDGYHLFFVSSDGSAALISFPVSTIGEVYCI